MILVFGSSTFDSPIDMVALAKEKKKFQDNLA